MYTASSNDFYCCFLLAVKQFPSNLLPFRMKTARLRCEVFLLPKSPVIIHTSCSLSDMGKWRKMYPQRERARASNLEERKYVSSFRKHQTGNSKLALLSETEHIPVLSSERLCLNATSSFHFSLFSLESNYPILAFCE